MPECQVCNSKLVTHGLIPGQQIRCANCQSISRFGKVETIATDRLAWRSFWFGISSILLLTITGIPAIYYGVRSLLRMRFVRPKRSDQAAAVIGTALGGCFGIFVGFMAVCGLFITLLQYWTFNETIVESEVAQECSQFFEFSSSLVVPVRATSALNNQRMFDFADTPEEVDRKLQIRLAFLRTSIQPNDVIMIQQLRNKPLGKTILGTNHQSDSRIWEFNGQPIDVRKSVYSQSEIADSVPESDPSPDAAAADVTHYHYWGYVRGEDGLYGISVVFEPGRHNLSDSDVKEIFAATRIKDRSEH